MRKFSVLLAAVALAATTSIASAQSPITLTFGPGRDGTQAGTATIQDLGSSFKVTLTMQNGIAAPGQPAHFHVDSCPGVGAVVVPLTNVVNGTSETTVNQRWADVAAKVKAINVHKSSTEGGQYVACVNIPTSAAAPAQLPRTGVPGVELFALLGTAFAGVGYTLRRRSI